MKKKIVSAILLCLVMFGCVLFAKYKELSRPIPENHVYFPIKRIAHAGGSFFKGDKKFNVTNSLDALEYNKNKFDLFEIDFAWTADEKIVCLHDWEHSAKAAFGKELTEVPTYEEFEDLVRHQEKFKNCTADSLMQWLSDNPKKRIVTDVKSDNVGALRYFAEHYPQSIPQIIPQIYHPDQFEQVKDMGYEDIIFTSYRFKGSHEEILEAAEKYKLYAFTVSTKKIRPEIARKLRKWGLPEEFIVSRLPSDLAKLQTPTYVHTINSREEYDRYRKLGVSEIYTDRLFE